MAVAVESQTPRARQGPPQLQEIPTPGALDGDRGRFWNLLWMTAVYEYRRQFMTSVLGYVWTLLKPLLLFAILLVLIQQLIRFGGTVPHYEGILLIGIMLFMFFQEGTNRTVFSLVSSQHIIRKMRFPRMVIPLSYVLTACMTAVGNLVAVFVLLAAFGIEPRWSWLLMPVIIAMILVFVTGLSLLLSALYVHFRDISKIWEVVAQALFYGLPVIYPIEQVPVGWREVYYINPMAPILEQARVWLVDPNAPNAFEAIRSPWYMLIPVSVVVFTCVVGYWYFKKVAVRAAEDI